MQRYYLTVDFELLRRKQIHEPLCLSQIELAQFRIKVLLEKKQFAVDAACLPLV